MIKVNIQQLEDHIKNNIVFKTKHPEYDLWIYNYTKHCVYERKWDETSIMCRGLILDKDYNIIARPFPKFFNYEELPKETVDYYMQQDYIAYEKMDGCLGILYFYNNIPYMASRGSFDSDYSKIANKLLNEKYSKYLYRLDQEYTHIFEIIHPKTKIVVDYHNQEALYLIGILKTTENKELDLESPYAKALGFPTAESFEFNSYNEIKELDLENREGYVLRFPDNYRMKIKFENYVKIHSVLSNVNNKVIYEVLKDYGNIEEYISKLPDETHDWCNYVAFDFFKKVHAFKGSVKCYVNTIRKFMENERIEPTMKELAAFLRNVNEIPKMYHSAIFKAWEYKEYDDIIWKYLKPDFIPFSHNLN